MLHHSLSDKEEFRSFRGISCDFPFLQFWFPLLSAWFLRGDRGAAEPLMTKAYCCIVCHQEDFQIGRRGDQGDEKKC